MGCGESKHDVVTDNTITHQKKSSNNETKKNEDTGTTPETGDNDTNTIPESENHKGDVKEVDTNAPTEEAKGGKGTKKEEGVDCEEPESGKLISRDSPSHFFSSRKDEEAIEAIVAQAKEAHLSSDLEVSNVDLLKKSVKVGDNVEEKGLVDEKKAESEDGNPVTKAEEVEVKEVEVTETIEAKNTSTIDNEKIAGTEQEHPIDSSAKDAKTI